MAATNGLGAGRGIVRDRQDAIIVLYPMLTAQETPETPASLIRHTFFLTQETTHEIAARILALVVIGGGRLAPPANLGPWDYASDCSAAKSDVLWLSVHVPSLASRSPLSSCVMPLDDPSAVDGADWVVDEDGSDEREGR